ncbi:MAG: response regulator [Cyanobacteria bacterium TGS_CYA1]|nr:response regulator [Cyanobacteria bacterium TGS_CYA1]
MSSVLLIKSDEPGAERLRQAILREEKYCVLVPNHAHAIRLMNSMTFDLVIIDIDSQEIIPERISEFFRCKNFRIPIIAYSNESTKTDAQELLNAGIDAFLPSPRDENEICDVIGRWLKTG